MLADPMDLERSLDSSRRRCAGITVLAVSTCWTTNAAYQNREINHLIPEILTARSQLQRSMLGQCHRLPSICWLMPAPAARPYMAAQQGGGRTHQCALEQGQYNSACAGPTRRGWASVPAELPWLPPRASAGCINTEYKQQNARLQRQPGVVTTEAVISATLGRWPSWLSARHGAPPLKKKKLRRHSSGWVPLRKTLRHWPRVFIIH